MSDLQQLDFPPLLVRASAGTGKTFQLSNRVISLLAAGERPERLLATTFTRKAAGEIQERIYTRLAKAALSEEEAEALATHIGTTTFDSGRARALLKQLVEVQHRLQICTLDSFYMQIATGFALELGLPLHWRMLEEADHAALVEEAVRRVVSVDRQGLRTILLLLQQGKHTRSIAAPLRGLITSLYETFRESDAAQWLMPRGSGFLSRSQRVGLLEAIRDLAVPTTKDGKPNKTWLNAQTTLLECIQTKQWDRVLAAGLGKCVASGSRNFGRVAIPDEWHDAVEPFVKHALYVSMARLRRRTFAFYRLLARYHRQYALLKAERAQLEFSDITYALANSAVRSQMDDIFFRLDTRIGHILLDEFQDTSMHQWSILAPLADEVLAQSGLERTFFCVGDTKQAIYAWRGGKAEIFDSLQHSYPQLVEQRLGKSWRSSQVVLDTVNRVFAAIPDAPALEGCGATVEAWLRDFEPHASQKALDGYVQLLETGAAEEQDEEAPTTAATFADAVRLIATLAEERPDCSIGVLVRKNAVVKELVSELQRRGIRASEEGGNPLTDSPAVSLLLAALHLIDHPRDSVAHYRVLESPLAEPLSLPALADMHAVSRWSVSMRERLSEEGLGALLSRWTEALVPHVDLEDAHRLLQFLELGYTFDLQGSTRTSSFIRFVRRRKVENPSGEQVRVMTIHKSKGLEFDIVVLPDLNNRFTPLFPKILSDRSHPLLPASRIVAYPDQDVRAAHEDLQAMYEQWEQDQVKQSLSMLYVALTRAVHALYMLVPPEGETKRQTHANVLRHALGADSGAKGSVLYEVGSPLWKKDAGLESAHRTAEAHSPTITLASQPSRHRRSLERRSPSSLEGMNDEATLATKLQLRPQAALRRGTAAHAVLERIAWLDDEVPAIEMLLAVAESHTLHAAAAHAVVASVLEAVRQPAFRAQLSLARYQARAAEDLALFREHPFAVREENTLLSGTFDRLVVGSSGNTPLFAHVIDFKTDRIENPLALEQKIKMYQPQLAAYRLAASKSCGLPAAKVEAQLLFLDGGHTYSLE
ncbi:MAG: UvrD-helicase domain-containing protein [Bdellovibrionales bacterium]|nr:UvrD-helicase domain-containing protein [Bdellovibrionales bacterium]